MRVLVVEDEPRLQKLLLRGLKEDGFSVDATGEGEEGLFLARTESYDAIVLDLMLPGVPGLTILETLRKEGKDTPVLILTARDGEAEKLAGLNRGADDYMTKPFSFAELAARLRALIRRSSRSVDPVVRVGDLEINTAARQVVRAGRTIELGAKEYALLELLALHAGRLVTRSQIYDHIYAYDSDTLSNVADVHVHRLRNKIDRGFGAPLIHTVRGQGYILREP